MEIRIKDVARRKNMTLFDLYMQWNRTFVDDKITHTTIYNWQCGRSQPDWDSVEKLCFLLDCGIEDLFQPMTIQFRGLKENAGKRKKSKRK